jgi:hypothetical protein
MEKRSFSDLAFDYGIFPAAMALTGAGLGGYYAPEGDRLRGALEGGALGGLGGLAGGASHNLVRRALRVLPRDSALQSFLPTVPAVGTSAAAYGLTKLFPERIEIIRQQHALRQRDKTAAYRLGFKLALHDAGIKTESKSQPTQLPHKPESRSNQATDTIRSTPRWEHSVVDPLTY